MRAHAAVGGHLINTCVSLGGFLEHLLRAQGLVAVDKAAMGDLPAIRKAMLEVQKDHAPTYT